MMMNKTPRKHQSSRAAALRKTFDKNNQYKAERTLLLSACIEDAMKEKGLNRVSFARLMNCSPSMITKWLSGTHSFTTDTLFDIESKLGITLVNVGEEPRKKITQIVFETVVIAEPMAQLEIGTSPVRIDYVKMKRSGLSRNYTYCAGVKSAALLSDYTRLLWSK